MKFQTKNNAEIQEFLFENGFDWQFADSKEVLMPGFQVLILNTENNFLTISSEFNPNYTTLTNDEVRVKFAKEEPDQAAKIKKLEARIEKLEKTVDVLRKNLRTALENS